MRPARFDAGNIVVMTNKNDLVRFYTWLEKQSLRGMASVVMPIHWQFHRDLNPLMLFWRKTCLNTCATYNRHTHGLRRKGNGI